MHTQARKDLFLQFAYTLSKAIDPSTGGSGYDLSRVSNSYLGWQNDVGPSILDRRDIAFVNFVYDLPILNNSSNVMAKRLIGGWEVSGIVTLQSGQPLYITEGGNIAGNVCNVANTDCTNRPNFTGSKKYPQTVGSWFDTSGFSPAPTGAFGNLPYNAFRSPGRDNWNLALFKSFAFNEHGSRLEFRAESFNTWNHTQFGGSGQNGGFSNNFGAGNQLVTSTFDPRVFQLGAKLIF